MQLLVRITLLYIAAAFGFLGWHYAIDGYVSIATMAGGWAFLRKREARTPIRQDRPGMATPAQDPALQPAE